MHNIIFTKCIVSEVSFIFLPKGLIWNKIVLNESNLSNLLDLVRNDI